MIRPIIAISWLAVLCVSFALSDDKPKGDPSDEIAVELTKAKEKYQATVEKANGKILGAFADQKKKLEDNTKMKVDQQIKLLEQLEEERKAFESDNSKLPKSTATKVAVSDYQTVMSAAKKDCEAAFDKAAKAYQSKKDFAAVKSVLQEKSTFILAVPVQQLDELQKGVLLAGSKKWLTGTANAGKSTPLTLEITERNGQVFKGVTISGQGTGLSRVDVTGKIKDDKIEWAPTKFIPGEFGHTFHAGKISGKEVVGTFKGLAKAGNEFTGEFTITIPAKGK